MVYKDAKGRKLYPVCSWEANQHKLYNAHDRIMVQISEAEGSDKDTSELWENLYRLEEAMYAFDSHVIGGIVYATWENGNIIKDYVGSYNARH